MPVLQTPDDPEAAEGTAADLLAAMADALRSAPPVSRDGPFPRAWWQHLADRGMLGPGFDADGGAARADWQAVAALAGLVAHETGQLGLALGWLMNQMLGRFVIGPSLANDSQRALLRRMADGRSIVALAISEPDAGAHPKLLRCAARRQDGQWLLDGEKSYVSNGPDADAFVVLAITGESGGRRRFDAFLVDADTPGLSRTPTGRAAVLPPLGHCGLSLVACRVGDDRRLATGGHAFDLIARPMRALEDSLLASAVVGAMQYQLAAVARRQRGAGASADALKRLGALRLEVMALATLASSCARELGRHGPGERLADLNAGVRLVLQRWQADCEGFAAGLDDRDPALLELAGDVRTVLGIARGLAEARHLKTGTGMTGAKENDESPA